MVCWYAVHGNYGLLYGVWYAVHSMWNMVHSKVYEVGVTLCHDTIIGASDTRLQKYIAKVVTMTILLVVTAKNQE